MKKIGIDITHYGRFSGYGVVTTNIVKGLLEEDKINEYFLFSNKDQDISNLKGYKNRTFINTNEGFTKYKFFSLSKHLKKYGIDTFLSLDQTLPFKKVCKYIVVEHDIGFQRLGKRGLIKGLFNKGFKKIWMVYYFLDIERIHLKNADVIITPSQFTKNEILQYYKRISEKKIKVIYRGMDHTPNEKIQVQKKNQILIPYSNLHSDFIIRLSNEIIKNHLAEEIVLLKPAFNKKSRIKINKNIRIIRKYISARDNERFYRESYLSIYLSSYDGFGIAPLESMFYGTPVIYNNIPCIKETSGEGGISTQLNINDILEKIRLLKDNTEEYSKTIKKGYEKVETYKRENTIEKIFNVLNQ